jgi:hypothetical protein
MSKFTCFVSFVFQSRADPTQLYGNSIVEIAERNPFDDRNRREQHKQLMAAKIIRIRQSEFDRLPVAAGEAVEETFARYVRAALVLAGIDPQRPLRFAMDTETGDILCRQEHQRFSERMRRASRSR